MLDPVIASRLQFALTTIVHIIVPVTSRHGTSGSQPVSSWSFPWRPEFSTSLSPGRNAVVPLAIAAIRPEHSSLPSSAQLRPVSDEVRAVAVGVLLAGTTL
ncbi:hypothetical protein C9J85_08095 [Haloferax sp. wsp5]|nr:hypothetical protein C9J85_08095 [Haloferax sp. wsp5]